MSDWLTLANHHPGFRFSLQWAPTDKDLSFLGSCPFAKGCLMEHSSSGRSPEIGKVSSRQSPPPLALCVRNRGTLQ